MKIVHVFAIVLLVFLFPVLNARKLIIRNLTPGSSLEVKQVNILKGGKNFLDKPNGSEEYKIGTISGPSGILDFNHVSDQEFTLQFIVPGSFFSKGKNFNVVVPQGNKDKVIVVDSHGVRS